MLQMVPGNISPFQKHQVAPFQDLGCGHMCRQSPGR
jgi:hypothetical protein